MAHITRFFAPSARFRAILLTVKSGRVESLRHSAHVKVMTMFRVQKRFLLNAGKLLNRQ
ncbi:hypothetical protein [Roseovarius sp. ZX-A-9]|uniref:hypothetical protein n=1 Tax=Roseovarius sp. ZX-A-9 TaxID=3014783 RepID=UPI00232CBB7A|nr:hypothetical protein [Roseovarius sp. ZX-A-9]